MAENINNEVIIQLEEEEPEDCPVCLEVMTTRMITLKPRSRKIVLKPCKHQFCQRCVMTIFNGLQNGESFRCPLCRQNVEVKSFQPTLLMKIGKWMSKGENLRITFAVLLAILALSGLIAYYTYLLTDPLASQRISEQVRKLRAYFE